MNERPVVQASDRDGHVEIDFPGGDAVVLSDDIAIELAQGLRRAACASDLCMACGEDVSDLDGPLGTPARCPECTFALMQSRSMPRRRLIREIRDALERLERKAGGGD